MAIFVEKGGNDGIGTTCPNATLKVVSGNKVHIRAVTNGWIVLAGFKEMIYDDIDTMLHDIEEFLLEQWKKKRECSGERVVIDTSGSVGL